MSSVLADSWYARELRLRTVNDELTRRCSRRLIARSALARGAALWWFGRRYKVVALIGSGTTFKMFMLLERISCRRRRYIVLLEFIPVPKGSWARLARGRRFESRVRAAFQEYVIKPALRGALLRAHSLSDWERERNAAMFDVDAARFVFLPWPLVLEGDELPLYGDRQIVLASGRSLCDWPTIFAAARGQQWRLLIVCSGRDLKLVERLNTDGVADVRHDIPLHEHRDMLKDAGVYLLALEECSVSAGQIRVMDAVRGGTPLVASMVDGLRDYIFDGETALTFTPRDAERARRHVNALLDDRRLGERLRSAAFARARKWTREEYMRSIGDLITLAESEAR
ncbi:MAG: glycosyltransferase [Actinobacteria bacterium]|nr:glycosyltransferase [Actinomycetota bacterium]